MIQRKWTTRTLLPGFPGPGLYISSLEIQLTIPFQQLSDDEIMMLKSTAIYYNYTTNRSVVYI